MMGHLEPERISVLLDEPWADKDGERHLEECTTCQAEFERLSRMRMALSALAEEEPPAGQWAAIEAALDAKAADAPVSLVSRIARHLITPGPLQAAAGLVLFAGGVFAGLQLTAPASGGDPADLPAVVSTGDDRALLDGLNQMESLRTPVRQVGIDDVGAATGGLANSGLDRSSAARTLMRLDGKIRALMEHLEEHPEDVAASAYLIDLVQQRDGLAGQLDLNGTRTW